MAIRQATFTLVAEQGIAGLKLATLAKRVGISPSTLYVYYKDKKDLIFTLFEEVTRTMIRSVVSVFDPQQPYKINLRNVWAAYLHYRIENHQEIYFYEQVKVSPYIHGSLNDFRNSEMEAAMQLIRLGKDLDLIKNLDENLLMAALAGMTDKFSDMFIAGEMELNEENLGHCFNLMWDTLKA